MTQAPKDLVYNCRAALMSTTKLAKFIIFACLTPIIVFSTIFYLVTKSEPYQYAKEFVLRDEMVKKQTGNIYDVNLCFYCQNGFSFKYSMDNGWAKYEINVRGSKAEGRVRIALAKKNTTWQISQAQITVGDKVILIKK